MEEQGTRSVASSPDTIDQAQQSNQLPTNLDTFTCFPKLPIEVRLLIWRWSFPRGREVNFGNEHMFKTKWTSVMSCIFQFEDAYPLPIALRVNKESRQETMKHYTVLFRYDSRIVPGQTKPIEKPFCYNPKLDTAWINPIALQPIYWHGTDFNHFSGDPWLPYLASAAPSVFANTRTLEIRGWYKIWPSTFQLGWAFFVCYAAVIGVVQDTVPVGPSAKPLHQHLGQQLKPLL